MLSQLCCWLLNGEPDVLQIMVLFTTPQMIAAMMAVMLRTACLQCIDSNFIV
jgi:hypothetical protein